MMSNQDYHGPYLNQQKGDNIFLSFSGLGHISCFYSWLQNLLMKVRQKSEKTGLKLNIQKMKIMASGPITSQQINGETMEKVTDCIFLGSKITVDGNCSHKIKRHFLLRRKAMTNLESILKNKLLCQQMSVQSKLRFFHLWMSELDYKEG